MELTDSIIKDILPSKTYLSYVDYNDNLEGNLDKIQNCIHQQSWEELDIFLDKAFSEQEWDSKKRYLKDFKNSLMSKYNLEKKMAKKIVRENIDSIEDVIYQRNDSDIISDLLKNTGRIIAHYDTGYQMAPDSWSWNKKRIDQEIKSIRKFLKLTKDKNPINTEMLEMMIRQATYGGNLLIYFTINPKEFIQNELKKSIIFEKFHLGIIDHFNGSGDISGKYDLKIELDFNPQNVFLEKCVKYNWTYSIAGMCSDWCDSTVVSFGNKKKPKIEKSKTNDLLEKEKVYNETFKQGSCTTGDMDINRHRGVYYRNDFPCGNKCPHCGTFWID